MQDDTFEKKTFMENLSNPSKALHITLWIVQVLLAAMLLWAAGMKLFQPVSQLAQQWPWTGQVAPVLVRFTGIIDLLAGFGLILPTLLRIRPRLTALTALLVIVLMITATIFHISRGEASVTGVNIVFAVMAAFVAWGRNKRP